MIVQFVLCPSNYTLVTPPTLPLKLLVSPCVFPGLDTRWESAGPKRQTK